MKQALGLVEIQGLTTAILAADSMAKAANIQLLEIENSKGLGYMTIKVTGDVGAVNAAVNVGRQVGIANQKLVSWKVIPRPSDYVDSTFCSPKPPIPPSTPGPSKETEKEKKPDAGVGEAEEPEKMEAETIAEIEPTKAAEAQEAAEPEKAAEAPEAAEPEKAAEAPEAAEPEKAAEAPETAEPAKAAKTTASAEAKKPDYEMKEQVKPTVKKEAAAPSKRSAAARRADSSKKKDQ